jgi:hypothetical protein
MVSSWLVAFASHMAEKANKNVSLPVRTTFAAIDASLLYAEASALVGVLSGH